MNTDNYLTDEEDLLLAHNLCRELGNNAKNRAIANVYATKIATKYFNTDNYNIDESSGLHNIPEILQNYDIADIYFDNHYIDVRLSFENDALTVPRKNIDNGFAPEAYMFVSINKDFANAQVLGFYLPDNLKSCNSDDDDYFIDENELITIYDVELHFIDKNVIEHTDEQLYDFLNDTSNNYEILNELITNKDDRLKLIKFSNANNVFKNISNINTDNNIDVTDEFINIDSDTDIDESIDNNLTEESTLDELYNDDSEISSLIEDEMQSEIIEIDNAASYDYSTEITPSLHEDEEDDYSSLIVEDNTNDAGDDDALNEIARSSDDIDDIENNIIDETDNTSEAYNDESSNYEAQTLEIIDDDNELKSSSTEAESDAENTQEFAENSNTPQNQLDTLFDDNNNQDMDSINENIDNNTIDNEANYIKPRANNKKLIITALSLAIIVSTALFIYNKNTNATSLNNNVPIAENNNTINKDEASENAQEAMPVEAIETNQIDKTDNEAAESVAIPAIENNLDASILVSNLKITWEVPAGYASNTAAKRYLVKLGKVIQLNLKTELLLLNKPPITNKIAVELSYNNSNNGFGNAKIITSSGEKSIDDVIINTVNKVLSNNSALKTDSISGIQGNPVLIIHL